MKSLITLLAVALMIFTTFAQTGSDSVVISDLVKKQINEIKQKQNVKTETPVQQPVTTTPSSLASAQKSSFSVSETQYILMFAAIEFAFAFVLLRRRYLRKKNARKANAPKEDNRPFPGNKRFISREEFAKTRSNLVCKLSLVKTQEELVRQAKKLNMGTGELELALRLQDMGKGTA